MDSEPLRVVLMWHLHQPDYRDPVDGRFVAPWSYLHALKDYSDMAAHLESHPQACAVVNITPVLLEQLQDYAQRLSQRRQGRIGDDLLDALSKPVLALDDARRQSLVRQCLGANRSRMIDRHEPYRQLADLAELSLRHDAVSAYLDDDFVTDLLVWYHLAWLGESLRRQVPAVPAMIERGHRYGLEDRLTLLSIVARTLETLPRRYRSLAQQGRVELSTSPHTHAILPLLLDFAAAHERRPELSLPLAPGYPGGATRVREQLNAARQTHLRAFGCLPRGCWPSEGAICARSVGAIGDAGFSWLASGQAVLRHSLGEGRHGSEQLHRPYRLTEHGPVCFFRDDVLSDLIGFAYKNWQPGDAVQDLVHRLEAMASDPQAGPGRVVVIALDGENAWEHYQHNAWEFLDLLYQRLSEHPGLQLTTFSRCLDDPAVPVRRLDRLVAGSWVYGDLGTWIGSPDKNQAWQMLAEAKLAFDGVSGVSGVSDAATRQLAVCEGSDWFWWPGDYNPEASVLTFERLYRMHLAGLYGMLGLAVPPQLGHVFSHGAHVPADTATMRPSR